MPGLTLPQYLRPINIQTKHIHHDRSLHHQPTIHIKTLFSSPPLLIFTIGAHTSNLIAIVDLTSLSSPILQGFDLSSPFFAADLLFLLLIWDIFYLKVDYIYLFLRMINGYKFLIFKSIVLCIILHLFTSFYMFKSLPAFSYFSNEGIEHFLVTNPQIKNQSSPGSNPPNHYKSPTAQSQAHLHQPSTHKFAAAGKR